MNKEYNSYTLYTLTHWQLPPPKVATVLLGLWGEQSGDSEVITNYVDWCELNHLHINPSKTKEVLINFSRKPAHIAPMNIQGLNIETVDQYIFVGVHLNNELNWWQNIGVLYKKGQSHAQVFLWLCGSFWCLLYNVLLEQLREKQEETK